AQEGLGAAVGFHRSTVLARSEVQPAYGSPRRGRNPHGPTTVGEPPGESPGGAGTPPGLHRVPPTGPPKGEERSAAPEGSELPRGRPESDARRRACKHRS